MRSELRVVSAYGDRRLVDPPKALRAFGVPPGGPFDRFSAALANALAGRPDDSPVLEIALGPVVLEAEGSTTFAVVGGPDGAFALRAGERFEVRPEGARAYVAVSPLTPSTWGAPERIPSADPPLPRRGEGFRRLADPPRLGDTPIRVVPGPQAGMLDFDRFLAQSYTVGLASNRVGVRLEGEPMPHDLSLPSEPAVPGAVQVPPNGQPIVLGPDGPTIGGYPKVAVVIDADLDRLGRARPGDTLRFEGVTLEEAREAARLTRAQDARRLADIRVALLDG